MHFSLSTRFSLFDGGAGVHASRGCAGPGSGHSKIQEQPVTIRKGRVISRGIEPKEKSSPDLQSIDGDCSSYESRGPTVLHRPALLSMASLTGEPRRR